MVCVVLKFALCHSSSVIFGVSRKDLSVPLLISHDDFVELDSAQN